MTLILLTWRLANLVYFPCGVSDNSTRLNGGRLFFLKLHRALITLSLSLMDPRNCATQKFIPSILKTLRHSQRLIGRRMQFGIKSWWTDFVMATQPMILTTRGLGRASGTPRVRGKAKTAKLFTATLCLAACMAATLQACSNRCHI